MGTLCIFAPRYKGEDIYIYFFLLSDSNRNYDRSSKSSRSSRSSRSHDASYASRSKKKWTAELKNVKFVAKAGFWAENLDPKKCRILDNSRFARKQRN